jgi:hypothetical protein
MAFQNHKVIVLACICLFIGGTEARAKDHFLTIGGGYAPAGNQASLERNVLFYQRLLAEKSVQDSSNAIYFADGKNEGRDLQVIDRMSVPLANRLMAEFFGDNDDLGLTYRNHQISDAKSAATPEAIRDWFRNEGRSLVSGDRLIIYVTSHGRESESPDRPFNTSISLWNYSKVTVTDLVEMLDTLPADVQVIAVMVQCHAGGFSRFIYNEGNPEKGISPQPRCGFFATVHDRPAAGCTPDIDEATYVEYSTFFWEAIAGRSRLNQPVTLPDYDHDGRVSFEEAHAYTVISSDTIDLPIKTSDTYLENESAFPSDADSDPESKTALLPRALPYEEVIAFATPSEQAILEGLSNQLELTGSDRLSAAERGKAESRPRDRSRFRGRPGDSASRLRRKIAGDLQSRWPELANLMNPVTVELVTSKSDDFVRAVESHPDFKRYRELTETSEKRLNEVERRVKFERFIHTYENVIRRENLKRMDEPDKLATYEAIAGGEASSL